MTFPGGPGLPPTVGSACVVRSPGFSSEEIASHPSSVNDGKVAYTQQEAKDKQPGGDRSRDKHRVGHRNRNTSTCGSEAGERDRGITPCPPPNYLLYVSPS